MPETTTEAIRVFAADVKEGLNTFPKRLPSKYFYDEKGDELFQKIMGLEEYYLTRSEYQIFQNQKEDILNAFMGDSGGFKLIELGAGDGTKTKVLLKYFLSQKANFIYSPIDISGNVLEQLGNDLRQNLPEIKVEAQQGDYFKALAALNKNHTCKEVVLFLGSNIGNFDNLEALGFLNQLSSNLSKGDMLFVGFDLMKDPDKILAAYNDSEGVTREFNMNLLKRINNELGGNFNIDKFRHVPTYDPITGETKSHLVSTEEQDVFIDEIGETFHFNAWEAIHTEVSQKYSYRMIREFAEKSGFELVQNFTDTEENYVNSLWQKL